MIDTSVVRVHQHGACISDNNHQEWVARGEASRASVPTVGALGFNLL